MALIRCVRLCVWVAIISNFTVNYTLNQLKRGEPTAWDPALACKHDYIEEVASHSQAHSDSQLGPALAPIILQMQHSEERQEEEQGGGWGAIKMTKAARAPQTGL